MSSSSPISPLHHMFAGGSLPPAAAPKNLFTLIKENPELKSGLHNDDISGKFSQDGNPPKVAITSTGKPMTAEMEIHWTVSKDGKSFKTTEKINITLHKPPENEVDQIAMFLLVAKAYKNSAKTELLGFNGCHDIDKKVNESAQRIKSSVRTPTMQQIKKNESGRQFKFVESGHVYDAGESIKKPVAGEDIRKFQKVLETAAKILAPTPAPGAGPVHTHIDSDTDGPVFGPEPAPIPPHGGPGPAPPPPPREDGAPPIPPSREGRRRLLDSHEAGPRAPPPPPREAGAPPAGPQLGPTGQPIQPKPRGVPPELPLRADVAPPTARKLPPIPNQQTPPAVQADQSEGTVASAQPNAASMGESTNAQLPDLEAFLADVVSEQTPGSDSSTIMPTEYSGFTDSLSTLSEESLVRTPLQEMVDDAKENLSDITSGLDRLFGNMMPQTEVDEFKEVNPRVYEKMQNLSKMNFQEYTTLKTDIENLILNLNDSVNQPEKASEIENEIYRQITILREKQEEWFPADLTNENQGLIDVSIYENDQFNAPMNLETAATTTDNRGVKNPLGEESQVEAPAAKRPRSTYAQASPSAFSNPPENMNISPNNSPSPSPRRGSGPELKKPPKLELPPNFVYTPPPVQANSTNATASVKDNVILRQQLQNGINGELAKLAGLKFFTHDSDGKAALKEFNEYTNALAGILSKLNNNDIETSDAKKQFDGLQQEFLPKFVSWMKDELFE